MKWICALLAFGFHSAHGLTIEKCSEVPSADRQSCIKFAKDVCSPHEEYNRKHCSEDSPDEAKIKTIYSNGMAGMGSGYKGGSQTGQQVCEQVTILREAQNMGCGSEASKCGGKTWKLKSGGTLDCNDFNINSGQKVCLALDDEAARIRKVWAVEGQQCSSIKSIEANDTSAPTE